MTGNTQAKDLEMNVLFFLLADPAIREKFGTKPKIKPFTSSTSGVIRNGVKFYQTCANYQMESKKSFGVVNAVANQDGVQSLEVYVDEKTTTVTVKPEQIALEDKVHAYILMDEVIRKMFGKKISLSELSNSAAFDSTKTGEPIFATYQVEGARTAALATIIIAADGTVQEMKVNFGEDDEAVMDVSLPPQAKVPHVSAAANATSYETKTTPTSSSSLHSRSPKSSSFSAGTASAKPESQSLRTTRSSSFDIRKPISFDIDTPDKPPRPESQSLRGSGRSSLDIRKPISFDIDTPGKPPRPESQSLRGSARSSSIDIRKPISFDFGSTNEPSSKKPESSSLRSARSSSINIREPVKFGDFGSTHEPSSRSSRSSKAASFSMGDTAAAAAAAAASSTSPKPESSSLRSARSSINIRNPISFDFDSPHESKRVSLSDKLELGPFPVSSFANSPVSKAAEKAATPTTAAVPPKETRSSSSKASSFTAGVPLSPKKSILAREISSPDQKKRVSFSEHLELGPFPVPSITNPVSKDTSDDENDSDEEDDNEEEDDISEAITSPVSKATSDDDNDSDEDDDDSDEDDDDDDDDEEEDDISESTPPPVAKEVARATTPKASSFSSGTAATLSPLRETRSPKASSFTAGTSSISRSPQPSSYSAGPTKKTTLAALATMKPEKLELGQFPSSSIAPTSPKPTALSPTKTTTTIAPTTLKKAAGIGRTSGSLKLKLDEEGGKSPATSSCSSVSSSSSHSSSGSVSPKPTMSKVTTTTSYAKPIVSPTTPLTPSKNNIRSKIASRLPTFNIFSPKSPGTPTTPNKKAPVGRNKLASLIGEFNKNNDNLTSAPRWGGKNKSTTNSADRATLVLSPKSLGKDKSGNGSSSNNNNNNNSNKNNQGTGFFKAVRRSSFVSASA